MSAGARILFLWHYYPWYLRAVYARDAGLAGLPYAAQRDGILADRFWWPAAFARYLGGRGYATEFVIGNAESLQRRWAAENGAPFRDAAWEPDIILTQVERFRPDVVWIASHFPWYGDFVRRIAARAGRVMAWVGEPWPAPDVGGIDVLVTENPDTFKAQQHRFARVIVTKPGFDPSIVEALGPVPKSRAVTFVGQFGPVHRRRAELVALLLRQGIPLEVFGTAVGEPRPTGLPAARRAAWELLRRRSARGALAVLKLACLPDAHQRHLDAVRRALRDPVYGMDMYRVLAASRLTLNVHGDIAGAHGGNMRMFEATGAGACLVTEETENIRDLFEPGVEVLTYRADADLLDTLRRALADPEGTARIARAGQARTLRQHTFARMLEDVAPAFAA